MINIKQTFEAIAPKRSHLFFRYYYRKLMGKCDAEMFYVDKLLKKRRRFIDAGANMGIYSYHFLSKMQSIVAFEPLPGVAYRLEQLERKSLTIHNLALSDRVEEQKIFIPLIDGEANAGLASLEQRDGEFEEIVVKLVKLDDFSFTDIDLIKIDVEGHEIKLIRGAVNTIKINKPLLLVEIEQRHIDTNINNVFKEIIDLGYKGIFLDRGQEFSTEHFEYEKHQKPYLDNVLSKRYINNFIFIPTT